MNNSDAILQRLLSAIEKARTEQGVIYLDGELRFAMIEAEFHLRNSGYTRTPLDDSNWQFGGTMFSD